MKTYHRDFSMTENSLVVGCSDLEEVASNRQEKFKYTAEYQEAKEDVRKALKKILSVCSGTESIGDIEDIFFCMESICFSAAYKDGISDLMTAMAFNKLGFTKVEYYDTSKGV